jgi:hypothetical protein
MYEPHPVNPTTIYSIRIFLTLPIFKEHGIGFLNVTDPITSVWPQVYGSTLSIGHTVPYSIAGLTMMPSMWSPWDMFTSCATITKHSAARLREGTMCGWRPRHRHSQSDRSWTDETERTYFYLIDPQSTPHTISVIWCSCWRAANRAGKYVASI